MESYKKPPSFGDKPYEWYIEELKAWSILTEVSKNKQAVAVALSFPDNDSTQIRDKMFNEVKIKDLNKEDSC